VLYLELLFSIYNHVYVTVIKYMYMYMYMYIYMCMCMCMCVCVCVCVFAKRTMLDGGGVQKVSFGSDVFDG